MLLDSFQKLWKPRLFGESLRKATVFSLTQRGHLMRAFGDLSAWAYEYAAGIVPLEPGFKKVAIRPHYLEGVDSFSATHRTPHGEVRVSWKRVDGKPVLEYSVPEGVEAVVRR